MWIIAWCHQLNVDITKKKTHIEQKSAICAALVIRTNFFYAFFWKILTFEGILMDLKEMSTSCEMQQIRNLYTVHLQMKCVFFTGVR